MAAKLLRHLVTDLTLNVKWQIGKVFSYLWFTSTADIWVVFGQYTNPIGFSSTCSCE